MGQYCFNNNNNNIHICIAPYGRNFRGAIYRLSLSVGEYRFTNGEWLMYEYIEL